MTDETQGAADAVADDTSAALDTSAEDQTLAQGDEHSGDDAAAENGEGEAKSAKPRKSFQERIDEKTRETHEERRLREDAEKRAEYWEQVARNSSPQPKAHEPESDGRPDPSTFAEGVYDPAYIDALTDWKADQAVEKRFTQREAQARTQTALQAFTQRVTEQFPDGEPAGLEQIRRLPTLSPVIQEVMLESDIGPKLANHLGANPRELARISALPPIQQARELTKLEMKLATPPAPTPKTATDAPAPTPQVRGSGGRFTVAPDTNDFAAFEKQYG